MKKKPKALSPARHFDQQMLFIAAFRYFLGRRTIATVSFARELARAWPELPENATYVIKRELEEAFEQDDDARAAPKDDPIVRYKALGDDCDRAAWEEVRRQYKPQPDECQWGYDAGHELWLTACGHSYLVQDFECFELKVCPGCQRVATRK